MSEKITVTLPATVVEWLSDNSITLPDDEHTAGEAEWRSELTQYSRHVPRGRGWTYLFEVRPAAAQALADELTKRAAFERLREWSLRSIDPRLLETAAAKIEKSLADQGR